MGKEKLKKETKTASIRERKKYTNKNRKNKRKKNRVKFVAEDSDRQMKNQTNPTYGGGDRRLNRQADRQVDRQAGKQAGVSN